MEVDDLGGFENAMSAETRVFAAVVIIYVVKGGVLECRLPTFPLHFHRVGKQHSGPSMILCEPLRLCV
jgi:hypothetical protein